MILRILTCSNTSFIVEAIKYLLRISLKSLHSMWRESDVRGALDEWKAGTQKSIQKLALSWNVSAATLFKRTKKRYP